MIFIWIPKTGGTSQYELWKAKGMKLYTEDYHRFDNTGDVSFGHASIPHLIKDGVIDLDYYDASEKVAIVRNPYDRFVSLYEDYKRTGRIAKQTFKDFCGFICFDITNMISPIGAYNDKNFSQASPQTSWLVPNTKIIKFEDNIKQLPHHLNSGNHKPYKEYYTKETADLVYNIYKEDFYFLGYDKLL